MSYARARLYLGISCVGMWVMLACVTLVFKLPSRFLSADETWSLYDASQLITVVFIYAFVQGVFDLFGGFVLPREYGRYVPNLTGFLKRLVKAVFVHSLLLVLISLSLITASRLGGFWVTLLVFIGISLVLISTQLPLSRLVGSFAVTRKDKHLYINSSFTHVTGGIAGLFKSTAVIPAFWQKTFSADQLQILIKRREKVAKRGSRHLGLAAALLWNVLGFSLAYLVAGGLQNVASFVTFSLYSTLWAFLGVLSLPTLSRRAVFQADALISETEEKRILADILPKLDQLQDNEYRRGQLVESVFHPIPSVARRLDKLASSSTPVLAPWHLARTVLYLSWANVSLLSRAVHCNIGRPEVWVFLPSD